jgi:hypothetical protein
MKKICLVILCVAFACGGNLSDEQRKKFKEGVEQSKIVHVTEAEIMTASLEKGHAVMKLLESKPYNEALIDSVQKLLQVKIRWVVPGAGNAYDVERQLVDAYIASMATGSAEENLQKIYSSDQKNSFDTLLYSKPAITKLPDGAEQLDGIWNIYIPKKQIVIEIGKTK